jgi:hypothetical protein
MLLAVPVVQNIDTFSDSSKDKIISFPGGGGTDQSSNIEIPNKAIVSNASFNVSTFNDGSGNYPNNARIDVGADGDYEWGFTGQGYGGFGGQYVFDDNQPSKSVNFQLNETFNNNTNLRLPKNATVYSTNMQVSAYNLQNKSISFGTGANWIPFWGNSWNSCRFQTLYLKSDINIPGVIGKIFFKAKSTNSNTAKFENFTVKFCKVNINTTSLSTTFGNNYGGNTPVTVYQNNLSVKFTNGQWFEIDIDDTFSFDNNTNLLLEILWNNDNGIGSSIEYGGVKTTRRAWSSSWTATTGGRDSNCYNIILGFGGGEAENVTIDIGANGGLPEYNHSGILKGSESVPDFTDELNSLIDSSTISHVDGYGNQFVDIPINVTNDVEGMLLLSDLDIRYNLTTTAFLNPHNSNLINELNELIPDTGEGNITIPFRVQSNSGGKVNISNISIDYYVPELTNDRLLLLNGYGPNKICYSDYGNYTFMVNITNAEGVSDVNDVTLILDADGEQIELHWDQNTLTFSELSDPKNLVALDIPNCNNTPIGPDRWNLEFSVRFDWAYPSEMLELCALNTTNDTGAWVFNYFSDVYRVENDLEFVGKLEVSSQYQGMLSSGNWVRASELITWQNLTVVYEGTTNFYPDDEDFNISITDNDNSYWVNTTSSGQPFTLVTQVDALTDLSDEHWINITNISGIGEDRTDVSFIIKIDADGPNAPPNIRCHADSSGDTKETYDDDKQIFITWGTTIDIGSGVLEHAMDYNVNPPTTIRGWGSWVNGEEGVSTFYVRARDRVGNWGAVGSDTIFIDLTNITFSQPTPAPDVWYTSKNIEVGIRIQDLTGSGVDGGEINYRYVESGNIDSGIWRDYNDVSSGESILCKQNITFDSDGADKKVQWRARDLANNFFQDPSFYTLKIDSTPVTFEGFSINFNKWHKTLTPEIEFFVNDTKPEDDESSGVDISSIKYSISTTGITNYGAWLPVTTQGSGESVSGYVKPTFSEGDENYIRFSGKDLAGNEIISQNYQLKIDVSNPEFQNPMPTATMWSNSSKIQCNITIFDEYSKVDIASVRYSISNNGMNKYGKWSIISLKHLSKSKYRSVTLTINDTFSEGENNYIRWWAFDTAGNNITSDDYLIRTDVTGCTYHLPSPDPEWWINTDIVICGIIINDTAGSGVNLDTIEYATKTSDSGPMSKWKRRDIEITTLNSPDSTTGGSTRAEPEIPYSVSARVAIKLFNEGIENYIYWRAVDIANNDYVIGGPYRVKLDLTPLSFLNPKPEPGVIQFDNELTCRINIQDDEGGSGVDTDSVEYRFSTTGREGYSAWQSESISRVKKPVGHQFIIYQTYTPGNLNYLQWRASDLAGNGPFESSEFNIIINSPPVPKISSPSHNPDKNYDYTDETDILFNARETIDPDGVDVLSFYWESNITGPIGYKDNFKNQLSPGRHMITLFVSDGYNHNASTFVNVTIARKKQVVDTDNDGIPDIKDPDLDNDDYPNEIDAFPYNKREWLDTDFDKIGNNQDDDDDNDGHLDEEDKYPLDSKRWKEEAVDNTMNYMLIVIIVIIIIVLLVVIMFMKSKKKKAESASQVEQSQSVPGTIPAVGVPSPTDVTTTTALQSQTPITPGSGPMPMPMPMMPMGTQPPLTVAPQSLLMPFPQFPGTAPQPGMMPMLPPPGMAPQVPVQSMPYQPIAPVQPQVQPQFQPQVQQQVPVSSPTQPPTQSQPEAITGYNCPQCGVSLSQPNNCPNCGWKQI